MRSTRPAGPPNPWLIQIPRKAASPSERRFFGVLVSSNTNSSTAPISNEKKTSKEPHRRPGRTVSGCATASKSEAKSTTANRQRWRMVAVAVGRLVSRTLRSLSSRRRSFLTITRQLICGRFPGSPGTVGVGRCPASAVLRCGMPHFYPRRSATFNRPRRTGEASGARRDTGGGVSGPARTRAYGPATGQFGVLGSPRTSCWSRPETAETRSQAKATQGTKNKGQELGNVSAELGLFFEGEIGASLRILKIRCRIPARPSTRVPSFSPQCTISWLSPSKHPCGRFHIMVKPIGSRCNLDCTYC